MSHSQPPYRDPRYHDQHGNPLPPSRPGTISGNPRGPETPPDCQVPGIMQNYPPWGIAHNPQDHSLGNHPGIQGNLPPPAMYSTPGNHGNHHGVAPPYQGMGRGLPPPPLAMGMPMMYQYHGIMQQPQPPPGFGYPRPLPTAQGTPVTSFSQFLPSPLQDDQGERPFPAFPGFPYAFGYGMPGPGPGMSQGQSGDEIGDEIEDRGPHQQQQPLGHMDYPPFPRMYGGFPPPHLTGFQGHYPPPGYVPGEQQRPKFIDVRDLEKQFENREALPIPAHLVTVSSSSVSEMAQVNTMEAQLSRLLGLGFSSPELEESGNFHSMIHQPPPNSHVIDVNDLEARYRAPPALVPLPQKEVIREPSYGLRQPEGSVRPPAHPRTQAQQPIPIHHLPRKPMDPPSMGRLSFPILDLYQSLLPPASDAAQRDELFKRLERIAQGIWPTASLHQYGSSANNLCLGKADMDLCLALPESDSADETLTQLAEKLEADPSYKDVKALTKTRVPIVKLRDSVTDIACDICFNNMLAIHNTRLLKTYSLIDPRVHQLALVIKYWAKRRVINEPYFGTLSSYCLILMLISYLQNRRPAVLPCLQAIYPGAAPEDSVVEVSGFNVYFFSDIDHLEDYGFVRGQNQEDLYALLGGFFRYYSRDFDYKSSVVSVRTGKTLLKVDKGWKIQRTPEEKEERKRKREEAKAKRLAYQQEQHEKILAAEAAEAAGAANPVAEESGSGPTHPAPAPQESDRSLSKQLSCGQTFSDDSQAHEDDEESEEEDEDDEVGGKTEKDPKSKPKRPPTNRFWLCVEDPFEVTHNLGRVVGPKGLYDIRGEFMRASKIMAAGGKLSVLCEQLVIKKPTEPKERQPSGGQKASE